MAEPQRKPQERTNGESEPPFRNINPHKTYSSYDEYFQDLDSWLSQAYFWYGVTAAFPYYLASSQYALSSPRGGNQQQAPFTFDFPFAPQPPPNVHQNAENTQDQSFDGIECRIPSLWKRIAAEAIDFLILFSLKLAMTFIATDFFDLVDLEKFDFGTFQKDDKLEYKAFLQMTHDFLVLEFVHRIVVCIFEAFWLQGGLNGRLGGATPGKSMMGLRVVRCESSSPLREDSVLVRPGTNLGLGASLMRAVVKNVVMAFLIPAGFAFLYFRHNRTGYDMICDTIVVEEPLIPHRRQTNPQE